MEKTKVRIVWNGQGGELDSVTVNKGRDDDYAVLREALVRLVAHAIVNPGDSFVIEEIS
jgi:hypothetical protein